MDESVLKALRFAVLVGLCYVLSIYVSAWWAWAKLAADYRATSRPEGPTYRRQSGSFNLASYTRCLTLIADPQGVYIAVPFALRLFHPPLFIPWKDIRNRARWHFLWMNGVKAEAGRSARVNISLPAEVFTHDPNQTESIR